MSRYASQEDLYTRFATAVTGISKQAYRFSRGYGRYQNVVRAKRQENFSRDAALRELPD